jgi:hypothetical protein
MSTDIPGWRFEPGITAFDAARILKTHLGPAILDYDLRDVIRHAVRMVDSADALGRSRPEGPITEVLRARSKARHEGDLPGAGRCWTWLGADPQDPDQRVYVFLNGAAEFENVMASIPGLSEYDYYSSREDPPEGLTREQYRDREKTWDRIIPTAMPKNDMLHLEIRDVYDIALNDAVRDLRSIDSDSITEERRTRVAALTPSPGDRIRDLAGEIATAALREATLAAGSAWDTETVWSNIDVIMRPPAAVIEAVRELLDERLPLAVVTGTHLARAQPDYAAARRCAASWAQHRIEAGTDAETAGEPSETLRP